MNVWKYPLERDDNILHMPKGAQPVHVASQAGQPCLWALVDPDAVFEPRRFVIIPTGQDVDGDYVGTYMQLGYLMFHVFEQKDD